MSNNTLRQSLISSIIRILSLETQDLIQQWIRSSIIDADAQNNRNIKIAFFESIKALSSEYVIEGSKEKLANLWNTIDITDGSKSYKNIEQVNKFHNNTFKALALAIIDAKQYINLHSQNYYYLLERLSDKYNKCSDNQLSLFTEAKECLTEDEVTCLGNDIYQ